jgi:alkanesulfonate monooxygenase SsuD/methylene tetrahydromethanopterin reductase-like flavin-dependent oxidoreductase (luciferase family)
MTVELSIGTPIVTLEPGGHARWEDAATIEDLGKVAETADRLGYHHPTCSEQVALPSSELARRNARYWDRLVTLGYIAALTQRIRITTNELVLAYHHPLEKSLSVTAPWT